MAWKPFSKRTRPLAEGLSEEIPELVRNRVLYALSESPSRLVVINYQDIFQSVERQCLIAYGRLCEFPAEERRRDKNEAIVEHALSCPTALFLDFLELCFRSSAYPATQAGPVHVAQINDVLLEEGVGYEFSDFVLEGRISIYSQRKQRTTYWVTQFPEATKKSNELVHATIVMPTLRLLANNHWDTANGHMMKAHEHYRHGDFRAAITECCSAFETVLKTICDKKQWPYGKDKDTLGTLVRVCREKGLFDDFYEQSMLAVGTIRNKLGAHGQEPQPSYSTEPDKVEHLIALTSSHIMFLASRANMK